MSHYNGIEYIYESEDQNSFARFPFNFDLEGQDDLVSINNENDINLNDIRGVHNIYVDENNNNNHYLNDNRNDGNGEKCVETILISVKEEDEEINSIKDDEKKNREHKIHIIKIIKKKKI